MEYQSLLLLIRIESFLDTLKGLNRGFMSLLISLAAQHIRG
jgi:hypothetical protein